MYEKLIHRLEMYANAIRILLKVYLTISLLPPAKLKETLDEVKKAIQITTLDYDIAIKSLPLYYDMKLVTFGIKEGRNLIVQFPISYNHHTTTIVLYQIETTPVPIFNLNKMVQSYLHLQVNKPYIALNSETYISLRNQELRMFKNIGYECYCGELFVVKHKYKYSCESDIHSNLGSEIIKENCNFAYYFNNTNIQPAVLDHGNEIILANLSNDKHIECKINNDITVRILSFSYVLLKECIMQM